MIAQYKVKTMNPFHNPDCNVYDLNTPAVIQSTIKDGVVKKTKKKGNCQHFKPPKLPCD